MFCEKCGKQINDDAAFCPYCGHTVNLPGQPVENPSPSGINKDVETNKNHTLSSKSAKMAFAFLVLTVLEYIFWIILTSENGYSMFFLRNTYYMLKPCRYALLFGPIINIGFVLFFLSGKSIAYVISVAYGLLSSIAIMWYQITHVNQYNVFDAGNGLTEDTPIRIGIIGAFSILMFCLLLIMSKVANKGLLVSGIILIALRNTAFVALYTGLLFKLDMMFRGISYWSVVPKSLVEHNYHLQFLLYIIVAIFGTVIYSMLVKSIYKSKSKVDSAKEV